jgi:hypothetical protein
MRIREFVSSLAGFALLLGMGQALAGQTGTAAIGGGVIGSGGGIGIGVAGSVALGAPGEPYSAVRKTTRVQKLANGTTITHITTVKEARDSSGRTYREDRRELPAGQEGGAPDFVFANVHDPVSRTNIHWNSSTKVADVTHFAERSEIKLPDVAPTQVATEPRPVPTTRAEPIKQQSEDLGIRTINGVEAKGTRMTRVIPAGRDGNDQPLTITSEWWRSEELGIMVMSVNDDPRTGTITMELTDLERGEPDAALFQVPEGYTVKDRTPQAQN